MSSKGLRTAEYAKPDLSVLEAQNKKTLDDDRGVFEGTPWFVTFTLLACDEVLPTPAASNDRIGRSTMETSAPTRII